MKWRIFISIFFFASIINAQTQKQAHPNLNDISCKTCHTCDIPTKENPCIRPCPRDKMISIDQSPEEGPNVLTIDKFKDQTDIYVPVIFSHRLHAEMSGMAGGCRMCHHYNPPGQVIGCSDCHELMRKRTDISKPDLKGAYHRLCMDCHRTWSGKVECESCHALNNTTQKTQAQNLAEKSGKRVHPKIIAPTILNFATAKASGKMVTFYHSQHVDLFGLECQSCHTNESCGKCHTKNQTISIKTKTTEQKHEVCSNCHDTKSSCNTCHSNTTKEGFNHGVKTGFDILKFHSKVSCKMCHVEKGRFAGLNSECINCHGKWTQENFKHIITGVVLDETHSALECQDCHQEKNYSKPTCKNCHDDKTFPNNVPGKLIKKKAS